MAYDDEKKMDHGRASAKEWLDRIRRSVKAFDNYNAVCDGVDRQFADLDRLAGIVRDRAFQMFWANLSVLAPSIYARPPVPVITPRFGERNELNRTTAELLERAAVIEFERQDLDGTLRLIRDDIALNARGVCWLRFDDGMVAHDSIHHGGGEVKSTVKATSTGMRAKLGDENVRIEHVYRQDFAHDLARNWNEVDWVARRSYLTEAEMKDRFEPYSGDAYKTVAYTVKQASVDAYGNQESDEKAAIWEIWCKSEKKVYWVADGLEYCLDDGEPHLTLDGFFPCPRPVYGTTERGSLIPVPDFLFYKDQLEEINELTDRISKLTEAVRVRGFYPAGSADIGDAVEQALKATDNGQVMVPVNNIAAFGGTGIGAAIAWLPVDVVVATIEKLISLRQQLFSDVYEITGLSDIMRGASNPHETATAQQLKSNYGSIRIRDRMEGIIRMCRDITRMTGEIIAENFSGETLMALTQIKLPSDADIKKQMEAVNKAVESQKKAADQQIKAIKKSGEEKRKMLEWKMKDTRAKAEASPSAQQQVGQAMQQGPDGQMAVESQIDDQAAQFAQAGQDLEGQIADAIQSVNDQTDDYIASQNDKLFQLSNIITIEKVVTFMNDERLRPYVLEIETDSTIMPDEMANKQRAAEFVQSVGGFVQQAAQAAAMSPALAPVMAELLKYTASQFRAGREVQTALDKYIKTIEGAPAAPEGEKGPSESELEQQKIQNQADAQKQQLQIQAEAAQQQAALEMQKLQAKMQSDQAEAQWKLQEAQGKFQLDQEEMEAKIKLQQTQADMAQQKAVGEFQLAREEQDQRIQIMQQEAALKAQIAQQEAALNVEILQWKIKLLEQQATANQVEFLNASMLDKSDVSE